ncbi:helix-turn-helix transcriptional regulator [Pseudomonas aeruginosa]
MARKPTQPAAPDLIRMPAVRARIGLSKSQIYRLIGLGEFPAPVPLGAKAVAWRADQVDAWIAAKIEGAREAAR